jgi:hypothetical protein
MLGFNGGTIGIANTVFTGSKSNDPNYSSVSLLLNGNGTNGSTTFTDSSSYNHTVTPAGDAQISTAQSKFGGASIAFDGNGDRVAVANNNALNFGTGDFTVECWVRSVLPLDSYTLEFAHICGKGNGVIAGTYALAFYQSKILFFSNTSLAKIGTSTLTNNTWYHFAASRSGSTLKLFVDGVEEYSGTDTTNYTSSASFNAGDRQASDPHNQYPFHGYIDDLRITKGVARYTSNFTPPTAQLPGGETGTFASGLWTSSDHIKQIRNELWPGLVPPIVTDGLVVHLDAGNSNSYPGSGTTWYDLSGNGNDGTISGATYDSANGGSLSFDGTNDYVSFSPTSANLNLFPITLSFWATPGGEVINKYIASSFNGYRVSFTTNGINGFYFISNSSYTNNYNNSYGSGTVGTFSNGVMIVDDSGVKFYLNDLLVGSNTWNGSSGATTTSTNLRLALYTSYMNGNIAQVSIYNKALTPSEVTQNFDALKGRYGL